MCFSNVVAVEHAIKCLPQVGRIEALDGGLFENGRACLAYRGIPRIFSSAIPSHVIQRTADVWIHG